MQPNSEISKSTEPYKPPSKLLVVGTALGLLVVGGLATWKGSQTPAPQEDITIPVRKFNLDYKKALTDLSVMGKITDTDGRDVKFYQLDSTQADRIAELAKIVISDTEKYKVQKRDTFEGLVKAQLKELLKTNDNTTILNLAYSNYKDTMRVLNINIPDHPLKAGESILLPTDKALLMFARGAQFPAGFASSALRKISGVEGRIQQHVQTTED